MVFVKHQEQTINGKEYEYYYLYESYYNPGMKYPQNFKVGKVGDDISSLVSSLKDKADANDIDLDQSDIDHFKIQLNTVEAKAKEEGIEEDELGEFYDEAFSGELGEDEGSEEDSEESRMYDIGDRFIIGDTYMDITRYDESDGEILYTVKEYDTSGSGIDLQNETTMNQASVKNLEEDADKMTNVSGLALDESLIPKEVDQFEYIGDQEGVRGVMWVSNNSNDFVEMKYESISSSGDRIRIIHGVEKEDDMNVRNDVKTLDGSDRLEALDKAIDFMEEFESSEEERSSSGFLTRVQDLASGKGVDHHTEGDSVVVLSEGDNDVWVQTTEDGVAMYDDGIEETKKLFPDGETVEVMGVTNQVRGVSEDKAYELLDKEIIPALQESAELEWVIIDDGKNGKSAELRVDTDKRVTRIVFNRIKEETEEGKEIFTHWNFYKTDKITGERLEERSFYKTKDAESHAETILGRADGDFDFDGIYLTLENGTPDFRTMSYDEDTVALFDFNNQNDKDPMVKFNKSGESYVVRHENLHDNVDIDSKIVVDERYKALGKMLDIINDHKSENLPEGEENEVVENVSDERRLEIIKEALNNDYVQAFGKHLNADDINKAVEEDWSDETLMRRFTGDNTPDIAREPAFTFADDAMVALIVYRPGGTNKTNSSNLEFSYEARYIMPYVDSKGGANYVTADASSPDEVFEKHEDGESSMFSGDYMDAVSKIYNDTKVVAHAGTDFPIMFVPKGDSKTAVVVAPRIEEE